MRRRPPRSTPTCTLCPYTTLFRSNSRESSPRVATERCLVGRDSRTPHALDIVEGGDKSDRFQNWRRPGLELVRRGSIFDVIAAEGCDHLAAAAHRWHAFEPAGLGIESPDNRRPIKLVHGADRQSGV